MMSKRPHVASANLHGGVRYAAPLQGHSAMCVEAGEPGRHGSKAYPGRLLLADLRFPSESVRFSSLFPRVTPRPPSLAFDRNQDKH